MCARKGSMQLKPKSGAEFTKRIEKDVLPLLRKQKGFRDEITRLTTGRKEAFGLSLWEDKESAETYSDGPYAEDMRATFLFVIPVPSLHTMIECAFLSS